ncbi:KilA-N domain-containing protein [Mucilaginibacter achroorhodeus]|uniref:KilA-N domain-containing protein n=1 Tax=Mucilaginibacter achroorhodeus TaxID=2599294 RepID=A0A563U9B7_9SPHI|nr:KilA-N domain-containing protein [Mucilaginibacter achroorhodeus]TWR27982.1 KilA-N domain-containing protein [Mucilaginibacter achroorhodeus]
MSKINVKGTIITISTQNNDDYICLTEMVANIEDGGRLIERWLNSKTTVDFLGVWEQLNNPNFKTPEFRGIKENVGSSNYFLSIKKWVEQTGAVGVYAKAGRHGSGTWAQVDIAFEFCSYISPEFKLLLITEFKNLKKREAQGVEQVWDFRRFLTKANWRIQTDAIQEVLIPLRNLPKHKEGIIYAEEAEVLNKVVFNKTAKEWNGENPQLVKKGHNIRDYGSTHQLIVIANLEPLNAELIRNGIAQYDRILMLRQAAIEQLKSLSKSNAIQDVYIDSPNIDKYKNIDINNIDTSKISPDLSEPKNEKEEDNKDPNILF